MNNILQMIAEYAKKEGIDLEEVEYEVKKPKASTEQKKEKSIELIKKYETITG